MLYRAAAIFIVLFWLTMTGLLVHQELRPGDSALREIPVSHVVKLIFMHRQDQQHPAPLRITSDKQPLGEVRLVPESRSGNPGPQFRVPRLFADRGARRPARTDRLQRCGEHGQASQYQAFSIIGQNPGSHRNGNRRRDIAAVQPGPL